MASTEPSYNILLIEDNKGDRHWMQDVLAESEIQHSLHTKKDGTSALEFIKEGSPKPDLIILDIGLPDISGHEVLAQINEQPEYTDTPVAVMTGSDLPEDLGRSYELFANCHLTKTDDPEKFLNVVRSMCERIGQERIRAPHEAEREA